MPSKGKPGVDPIPERYHRVNARLVVGDGAAAIEFYRQAFGAEKAGLVFGWIMAAHQVGAAASASFAGIVRTTEGNYDHAFMFAGVLCLISAVGVLFAGKRPAAPALHPQPG